MFGYLLTKMRNMQKECYENININSRCLICKYNEEKLKILYVINAKLIIFRQEKIFVNFVYLKKVEEIIVKNTIIKN